MARLDDRADDDPPLDSFILSCRAMGREVETAIMNRIKADYLQDGPYPALTGVHVPSKKNAPVTEFYPRQGFELVGQTAAGTRRYRLPRAQCQIRDCHHITVT